MKILHLIQCIDPRYGGPTNVLRSMVREQVRRGDQVAVLTTNIQSVGSCRPADVYRREMLADPAFSGAEVCLVRAFGRRKPWSSFAFSPEGRGWLRRRLSDRRLAPDVIHVHGVFSHLFVVAAAEARRRNIPYIIEPAGSLDSGPFRMGSRCLKRIFTRLLLNKDLRHAACVLAASPFEAGELRRQTPEARIQIVPHGFDIDTTDPAGTAQQFLAEFPQARDRRIVLCLARVAPIKRMELLVEALGQLHGEYPDLMLLIVGPDEGYMAVVKNVARRLGLEDSVVFTGFLTGELKAGAFAVADCFALVSSHENFGITVVEAMAHGLPVLVTPGVASHEYVDDSGGGITVEDGIDSITEGLREILKADREELGRRGRKHVEKTLSWSSVIKQLDALYRDVLVQ